jgi:hypothetical protein
MSRAAAPPAADPRAKAIENADGDDEQQSPGNDYRLHEAPPSEDETGRQSQRNAPARQSDGWSIFEGHL